MREMDLVLGSFADSALAGLTDRELDELEGWLDVPDQQIFAWLTGVEAAPEKVATALFKRLRAFHGMTT